MDHTYSKNLALYFDMLRSKRKLTQEQFVEGIISLRQYRRYLRGESMLSQLIINAFCDKLGFKSDHVILDFEIDRHKESEQVFNFYNAFANQDNVLAQKLKKDIESKFIMNKDNQMLYQYTLMHYHLRDKKMTEAEFIDQTKTLIDFNDTIKKEVLTAVELVILSVFLDLPGYKEKDLIVEKIEQVLRNERKIITENQHAIQNFCMVRLAKYYGIRGLYQSCLDICNLAIKENLDRLSMKLMDYFYYFNSLSYYYLGNKEKHEEYVFKCFSVIKAQDNPAKYKKFKKLIEEDYHIVLEDFVSDYIQKQRDCNEIKA